MYNLDENIDNALKQEIIAEFEVEENYLYTKKQRYMGFHDFYTNNLVDHLVEIYGKIRASDLEACRQDLAEPIDVDRLIYVYL